MTYARLIVNPAAGAGKTAKRWPIIKQRLLRAGLKFEHDITEAPGHAIDLAKAAVGKGYRLIVSVGGDGTVNEVVNGLYATGQLSHLEMGIIGTGTGGDYIRTIGVPRQFLAACERLENPRRLAVDLGMVEYRAGSGPQRRLFANFAGLGFDAEVVRATTIRFKKLGSTGSYLAGLLTTLMTYRNRQVTLKTAGNTETLKACAVIISNGRYAGGNMFIAPQASIQDGLLDVIVIGDVSKPDLLASLPRVYRGTHLTHPKISVRQVREVEVSSGERAALQADGELCGQPPARFTVLPQALNVLI